MIHIAREVARVRYPVLALSALAWGTLALGPDMHVEGMQVYCSATGGGPATIVVPPSLLLALNPPATLAAMWALMLIAMMSPIIVPQIHHVRFSSLRRRRARSIGLFLIGYGGVWMLGGVVLATAAIASMTIGQGSYIPTLLVGLATCVWQASPFKQQCLNGCHDKPPLRVFGLEADLDAFQFGWSHGVWCVGSCFGLMLFSVLLPGGHLMAMGAVATVIFCERLEDPEPVRWKIRGLGKVSRAIMAHIRLRWRMLRRELDLLLDA